jgi:hypothetical protein
MACANQARRTARAEGALPGSGRTQLGKQPRYDRYFWPRGPQLLEVAARGTRHSARNVGYRFDKRLSGESKAGLREGLVFLATFGTFHVKPRPSPQNDKI